MQLTCYRFHLCVEHSLFTFNIKETIGKSEQELEDNKQNLFWKNLLKIIKELEKDDNSNLKEKYSTRLIFKDDDKKLLFFRFGKLRQTSILEVNLKTTTLVNNWEKYSNIFIDLKRQIACIEEDNLSFKMIDKNLFNKVRTPLSQFFIQLKFMAMSESKTYWNFIRENRGTISELFVEVYGKNMPHQTQSANVVLKRMQSNFQADKSSFKTVESKGKLVLSNDDPDVIGIAELADSGMAKVEMKTIKTEESPQKHYNSQSKSSIKEINIEKKQLDKDVDSNSDSYIKYIFELIHKCFKG